MTIPFPFFLLSYRFEYVISGRYSGNESIDSAMDDERRPQVCTRSTHPNGNPSVYLRCPFRGKQACIMHDYIFLYIYIIEYINNTIQ